MSSGCGDVLSLADLQTAKKHQLFEAEVITGLQGGVAGGAPIDYATNQVTGQTQKTLPAVLRDAGFQPASFDFSTGGTLGVNDRNKVVYDPVSKTWYSWGGALPHVIAAGTNPVGVADWHPQTDPNIRADLASTSAGKGAGLVGTTTGQTVEQRFESIETVKSATGFNVVGRFLNLAALRAATPAEAGVIVFVASSYSTAATQQHLGGGFFESIDNTAALPDDGGVVVKPATGTLAWKRINFSTYDMRFWGVTADGATDNAAAITRAMNYARANRIIVEAPAGSIHTSEMVPIYSNCGLRGQGIKAEGTVFYKTTNNGFPYKNGATTVISVDALVGFVPNKYDLSDPSMESFCVHARLETCMFRRLGLTGSNVAAVRPAFGLHLSKVGAGVIKQVAIEGGYIGVSWNNCFSTVMEMVSATQYAGFGYAGFSGQDVRGGVAHMTGTSIDMRLCQCSGYQFGFDISRLQYSTMTNCTAETISPMSGETVCYAFQFTDPYSVVMNTCATEFVTGGQIRVLPAANPSFTRTLVINGYLPIDQQNPVAATPMYSVDSGGAGSVKLTFIGCDLARQISNANSTAPVVSGSNAKVVVISCGGEDWTTSASGVFTRLA